LPEYSTADIPFHKALSEGSLNIEPQGSYTWHDQRERSCLFKLLISRGREESPRRKACFHGEEGLKDLIAMEAIYKAAGTPMS